jgi:hypothetical protein
VLISASTLGVIVDGGTRDAAQTIGVPTHGRRSYRKTAAERRAELYSVAEPFVEIGNDLIRQGFAKPNRPGEAFEAHHIKPSVWGGDNTAPNGVWLEKAEHQNFTTWWDPRNFTP